MDITMLMVSFILGLILGFVSTVGLVLYLGKKSLSKKLESKLDSLKDATKKIESVSDRMKKVKDIVNQ